MTQKMKPVWRENTGNKPPFDESGVALLRNGRVTNKPQAIGLLTFDFTIQGLLDDVIVYQTTRTKAAKYQKVQCRSCKGYGTTDGFTDGNCPNCKGHGHTWEPIK